MSHTQHASTTHIIIVMKFLLPISCLYLILLLVGCATDKPVTQSLEEVTVQEIKAEDSKSMYDLKNRPLPLFSSWEIGATQDILRIGCGYTNSITECKDCFFTPKKQVELIKEGHHILPAIGLVAYHQEKNICTLLADKQYFQLSDEYFEPVKQFSTWGLPISIVSSQWEDQFHADYRYRNKPRKERSVIHTSYSYEEKIFSKGDTVTIDGKTIIAQKDSVRVKIDSTTYMINPCGNSQNWEDLGRDYADSSRLAYLQQLYPDPPRVIMLSNDESSKITHHFYDTSRNWGTGPGSRVDEFYKAFRHYYETYPENCRLPYNKVDSVRYILNVKYTDLFTRFRHGLFTNMNEQKWKDNMLFVGYNTYGFAAYGRYDRWIDHPSILTPDHYRAKLQFWNGGSPAYYAAYASDHKVHSNQVQVMNNKMLLDVIQDLDPNKEFWNELSISSIDGQKHNNIEYYSPERYIGMVQFGIWLMRPRVVREFVGHTMALSDENRNAYFYKLLGAVDTVYNNDTLKRFWREGRLVKNTIHEHPYNHNLLQEYKGIDRWYLLDVNKNLPHSELMTGGVLERLSKEIKVFAIALETGIAPNREWLIYAHAPKGDIVEDVEIAIPTDRSGQTRAIEINRVSQSGEFFYVKENSNDFWIN